MKKFISFLVTAAIMAIAGAASAGDPSLTITGRKDDDTANNGAITTGAGTATTKVYYFGTPDKSLSTILGVKLTPALDGETGAAGDKFAATIDSPAGTTLAFDPATFNTSASATEQEEKVTISGYSAFPTSKYTVKFDWKKSNDTSYISAQPELEVTPVKVELEIPGPIRIVEETETTKVQIKMKDKTLTPHFFGDGFKADPPAGNPPTITPGLDGLVINASNADPGTYVFEVKTQPGTSMTVDEDGGATGIAVANFNTGNEVKVCEMTVIIVGYEVTPSSADWDSTSPTSVKFKVDMPIDDFKGIGLKNPNDTEGTNIGEIDTEFYTVTPTADGIEIEIALEYLVKYLTVSGDYVFNVADEDNRQAYFTLRVTIDPENDVPATGVKPLDEDAQKGPPGIEYEIIQIRLSAGSVKSLLPKDMLDIVSDDGRIKQDEAAKLTGADPDTLTVLPSVAATLTGEATIAAITFNVKGAELVSEEVDGIRWYDAIIHKMFVRDGGLVSARLAPARTWDAIKDGTFMIMVESNNEVGDPVARLLSDDYVIKRNNTQYKLVVYVEDNGDYDLDKDAHSVVDPLIIQTSSGGGSSSSCGTGLGLATLVGLAALALRRRIR